MTVVLVHGNPETPAVWDLLVPHLTRGPVVRLAPPGFGAPVPEGFGATVIEYRDWLVGELEPLAAAEGPVDLVGHDWGGGHVLNVAMVRPDLLRSWVVDVVGILDPDYVWHELAQVWQREGAGEEAVAAMLAAGPEARVERLVRFGMDARVAERIGAAFDQAMADSILRLYRSAAQPVLAELGADLEKAAARPGLALMPTEDHMVGTEEQRHRAAARAGARVEVLAGLGHWWMTQDPERGAAVLDRFWAEV
ncbi:alpha/beta hydrolase [Pseudonocardia sp. RS11V-5]|uniref:alpha/beta fold hydrolase n=1 Tax=Pseudonocardia terrae TaxID=2905831 RepID=UPI001E459BC9|nr:alpha/beta hydrolase [Pseudonocardia terrae]MCE3552223.1 alpha/beta hydrolase [Pseudonocardia terrae]